MKILSNLARLGGCTPGNPGMRRKINLEAKRSKKVFFLQNAINEKVAASETESPESFRSCWTTPSGWTLTQTRPPKSIKRATFDGINLDLATAIQYIGGTTGVRDQPHKPGICSHSRTTTGTANPLEISDLVKRQAPRFSEQVFFLRQKLLRFLQASQISTFFLSNLELFYWKLLKFSKEWQTDGGFQQLSQTGGQRTPTITRSLGDSSLDYQD